MVGLVLTLVSTARAQVPPDPTSRTSEVRVDRPGSVPREAGTIEQSASNRSQESLESPLVGAVLDESSAGEATGLAPFEDPEDAGPVAAGTLVRGAPIPLLRDRAGWLTAHAAVGGGFGYLTGRHFELGPKWLTKGFTSSLDDKERALAYGAISATLGLVLGRLAATGAPKGSGRELWIESTAGIGRGSGLAGGGLHAGYRAGLDLGERAGVGVTIQTHTAKPSRELDERTGSAVDAVSAMQLSVDGRLMVPAFSSGTRVFLQYGVGRYSIDIDRSPGRFLLSFPGGGSPKSGLGFHVGLGMDLRRGENAGVGLLALYHVMPGWRDVDLGMNEATLGLTMRWRAGT